MMISAFAKAAGLSVDTVRFYIAKGLLCPKQGEKGGSRPYQLFDSNELTCAKMIRLQQSLGYSLNEIADLNREYRSGARCPERTAEVLRLQIERLQAKKDRLDEALSFLQEKLEWVETGQRGDAPRFDDYLC
ncbi:MULTISPECIES: MerR family transcriptional regulator [Pseudomonas]|jgi:DNA-binding transcriptional MerR regulator|uniref:MerR family transcriptional regulator n=1 Tax=Pseudomonas TaxID=286 RepID=UPI001376A452|nr:MerR family transcriptional regulator [Pseudomonas putida]NBA79224.1 MerR family transcriptional regulator [Pseudomonas putida]